MKYNTLVIGDDRQLFGKNGNKSGNSSSSPRHFSTIELVIPSVTNARSRDLLFASEVYDFSRLPNSTKLQRARGETHVVGRNTDSGVGKSVPIRSYTAVFFVCRFK